MDTTQNCILGLCDEIDSMYEATVTDRGLPKLQISSKLRNDGLHIHFFVGMKVHEECRKRYTRRLSGPLEVSSPKRLRSSTPTFNFRRDCFLCGKEVPSADQGELIRPKRYGTWLVRTEELGKTISAACDKRGDAWGIAVKGRLEAIEWDLVSADARYHHVCYITFRDARRTLPGQTPQRGPGRRPDPAKSVSFNAVCDFLRSNDDCQFSLDDLYDVMCEAASSSSTISYTKFHLSRLLKVEFQDAIHFVERKGRPTLLMFHGRSQEILSEQWYLDRKRNLVDEKLRIVKAAAAIVRDDIRSQVCDIDVYPCLSTVQEGGKYLVPQSLFLFLEEVVKGRHHVNASQLEAKEKKLNIIAQSIMTIARPRSFLSPVLFGLGVLLHRKYGSRFLIDLLHKLGVCISYEEAIRFESSVVQSDPPSVESGAYLQFVFDNADFNVSTLDGKGTFHCMGGIKCITPAAALNVQLNVPRKNVNRTAEARQKFGFLPLKQYRKQEMSGLARVRAEDIEVLASNMSDQSEWLRKRAAAELVDIVWMASICCKNEAAPSWSGFLEIASSQNEDFDTSSIVALPFINLQASNPAAIFTCLEFAADECIKHGQAKCCVTFDQPLFIKAMEIVLSAENESPLTRVIVRLGGFHMLMSFLGAIGQIMIGSGLEELFGQVYAVNSVPHMISGRAYSRSLRAHSLAQLALFALISVEVPFALQKCALDFHASVIDQSVRLEEASESVELKEFNSCIDRIVTEKAKSRTGKLWIKYFELVQIVRTFVRAERLGLWDLHLDAAIRMVPYFFAAGHLNYGKSSLLYIQQMLNLETSMPVDEYDKFVRKGYFCARRTVKKSAGIWTDMLIETTLMRSLKCEGGITRGRGVSDAVIASWVCTMPLCATIRDAVEQYVGIRSLSGEQHVELREARQERDYRDFLLMKSWLQQHSPFDKPPESLVGIASGIVADSSVNCDCAAEVGKDQMCKLWGKSYNEMVLSRKAKITPLAAMRRSIRVHDVPVVVDTEILFQRMTVAIKDETELQNCFSYELAPYAPSLFDSDGRMRKGDKSAIVPELEKLVPCQKEVPGNTYFVIDGGFLLRKVVWPSEATFETILAMYEKFVLKHYGANCSIVFDGYSKVTTKDQERTRRSHKAQHTAEVWVEEKLVCSVSQVAFLSSSSNKDRLIGILKQRLHQLGVHVLQAEGDADTLIVQTAVQFANSKPEFNVTVIGSDTDLLLLVIAHASKTAPIYFVFPVSYSPQNFRVYKSDALQGALGSLSKPMLAFHALTGSDFTSYIFGKGKIGAFRKFFKTTSMQEAAAVFLDPEASPEKITEAGEDFIRALYNIGKNVTSLNSARYQKYRETIRKISKIALFKLSRFPPTSAACQQHCLRAYLQVQNWLGNTLPPCAWGWERPGVEESLRPNALGQEPAPKELLRTVFCNCTKGCGASCSCRKAGLKCSPACGSCAGTGCSNAMVPLPSSEGDSSSDTEGEETVRVGSSTYPSTSSTTSVDDCSDPDE